MKQMLIKLLPITLLGRLIVVAGVLLPVACLALGGLNSFDTWWHLASGRWIVEHQEVPRTDPFTYSSAGRSWIDLHWLFQLGLWGVYQGAGVMGVVLLRMVLVLLTMGLLLWRFGRGTQFWIVAPGCLLLAVVASERWMVRPEVVTHLIMVIDLVLLIDYRTASRRVWWVVPLQCLWVNVQGTFVLGVGLVGVFWIGECMLKWFGGRWCGQKPLDRKSFRYFSWIFLAVIAVNLVNPFGVQGALFPLELWTRISGEQTIYQQHIMEFIPTFSIPDFLEVPRVLAYMILLGTSFTLLLASCFRVHPGLLLAYFAFAYLSFKASRNLPLLGYVAVPVLSQSGAQVFARLRHCPWPGVLIRRRAGMLGAWVVGFLIVLTGLRLVKATISDEYYVAKGTIRRWGPVANPYLFPHGAVEFLKSQAIDGRVLNDLGDGGYLIFHLQPGRVFIDGRLEVHDKLLYTYQQILNDEETFFQQMDKRDIHCVVWPHLPYSDVRPLERLLNHPDWKLVYADFSHCIFLRRSAYREEQISGWQAAGKAHDLAFLAERDQARWQPSPAVRWLHDVGLLRRPVSESFIPLNRGLFFERLGQPERAAREYARLIGNFPENAYGYANLARIQSKLKQPQQAIQTLSEGRRVVPTDPVIEETFFDLYISMGQSQSAWQAGLRALEMDSRNLALLSQLTLLALQQGDTATALRAALRTVQLAPQNPVSHYNLGHVYLQLDEPDRARRHLEQAKTLQKDRRVTPDPS